VIDGERLCENETWRWRTGKEVGWIDVVARFDSIQRETEAKKASFFDTWTHSLESACRFAELVEDNRQN
jgi:hypothetical protein